MSQETERYQLENNGNTYLARASASGGGTEVVANPTLAGTESALTGLQVGDTKYAVESGMTNPMTTVGDLIVGGTNGVPTRIAKPSSSKFLRNTSSGYTSWESIGVETLARPAGLLGLAMYSNNNSVGTGYVMGKPASDFGLGYLTTAPTADNTDGIKIVVLTSEPATRYNGYLYIITA